MHSGTVLVVPIDRATLDAIARDYTAGMTSIRGRRVHRLLMREFAPFDAVNRVVAPDGTVTLMAGADDGSVALCQTDGRGHEATIARRRRPGGAIATTSYDLPKDALPQLPATAVSKVGRRHVAEILRQSALARFPPALDRTTSPGLLPPRAQTAATLEWTSVLSLDAYRYVIFSEAAEQGT